MAWLVGRWRLFVYRFLSLFLPSLFGFNDSGKPRRMQSARCVHLCKLINVVQHFKAHFNHNQYDDHPLQPYVMVVVQVGAYQVSQLDAVIQLLVHHPCPSADAEVCARLVVQRLQLLPVPIEIGRVQ
uniref:Putative secreted peptide n=1 Tax=Anopheles braziliensis TaxID=58242 RepID=A0A2M3ZTW5_9DIPT